MTHPHASTKLSPHWSNKSWKIELFSIIFSLLLLVGATTPLVSQARIQSIKCQIDQKLCPDETNDQLHSLFNQPILLTSITTQLESSGLTPSYQVTNLSISLPNTLNINLATRAPRYFLIQNNQTSAISADGNLSTWSSSDLPPNIPQIFSGIELSTLSPTSFASIINPQFHTQLVNFLDVLQASGLSYFKLELIDSTTMKMWLTAQDWVLLDLSQASAVQKIMTVLSHPDFQSQVKSGYQLDLRFQYPLLLKTN